MNDFQKILDITFPFVESLLREYGEFYPLATIVNNNGNVEQFTLEEDPENDFPKSDTVIGEIKKNLRWNQDEFVAFALFYDVFLKEKELDAIEVLVEHKIEQKAYTFYYPYKIIEDKIEFFDSWKTEEIISVFDI